MTQHVDFVALGWVEKYLREEMDTAKSHLYSYQREPEEVRHLREALRNVHSATGVLRLCALDPAALLTQEIERVIGQLVVGKIAGEARKLAMTELAAAIEALPAYLANVRAKREVSAGVIANVINDLRHFGNRPSLPDSLFFNPSIKPTSGITQDQQPADDARLRQFGARALRVCAKYSKLALKRDRDALKQLFAVGKHATRLLAGSQMEPYFRCHMGLIEALAQPYARGDEVIIDVFRNTFAFLKSLALSGTSAIDNANPTPHIKKMLYYIAKTPAPTRLQQNLRDIFDVQNVDEVGIASAGRLIQEDDLLEALNDTMSSLLGVMEFMTSQHRDIHAGNSLLVNTIVPQLRQVGLQLKAIGLITHADTISEQYEILKGLAEREKPVAQAELLDFGGALIAVKESLEHKLKHGLSAEGDSMGHDLDSAIMAQTFRCLSDMKSSISREFARQDLLGVVLDRDNPEPVSIPQLRPVHRAASLVDDVEIKEYIGRWEQGELPERGLLVECAEKLLEAIPENSYAEQAAADMVQVVSVLALMEDKQRESGILNLCIQFIRDSIVMGGLVNDDAMACFAEAIAALEQFMERRTEDPLGNADDHLDRAESRANMLAPYLEERSVDSPAADNIVQFESRRGEKSAEAEQEPAETAENTEEQAEFGADVDDQQPATAVSMELEEPEPEAAAIQAVMDAEPGPEPVRETPVPTDGSGVFWREALKQWSMLELGRGPDAPLENPDADVDEELVECFVEEARKYVRKLQDTAPLFADDLDNEKCIQDIRAVFHTMKGSARTIELFEFGEFMYDMEKIFNAIRDDYIKGSPAIAELLTAVADSLPEYTDLLLQRVPLYTSDFRAVHQIAAAMSEKRFDPETMQVLPADHSSTEIAEDAAANAAGPEGAEADEPVTGESQGWPETSADEIVRMLSARLHDAAGESWGSGQADSALVLLHAIVPVLCELNKEQVLGLDDAGLSQALQLPVVVSVAENAESGTLLVGAGAPIALQLAVSTVDGVKRYIKTLSPADGEPIDPSIHDELEAVLRQALSLPAPATPLELPDPRSEDEGDQDELEDIELESTADAVSITSSLAFDPEDIPITDPPPSDMGRAEEHIVEGNPLSPKLDGASEPDQDLVSESAFADEFVSELDVFDVRDLGTASDTVDFLDLGEELEDLAPEPVPEAFDLETGAEQEFALDTASALTESGVEEIADEEFLGEGLFESELSSDLDLGSDLALESDLPDAESLDAAQLQLQEDDATEDSPADLLAAEMQEVEAEDESPPVHETIQDAQIEDTVPEPVEEASPQRQVIDFPTVDIDMELLEIFIESLDDSIESIDGAAADLDKDYAKAVQRLKNTLHTLKGGANSIGLRSFGALVHEFESSIGELEYKGLLDKAEGKTEVYIQLDLLHEAAEFVKKNQTDWNPDAPQAQAGSQELEDGSQEDVQAQVAPDAAPVSQAVESIRVPTNKIDRLLDVGLEVSMSNVRTRRALDRALQDRNSVQTLARRVEEIVDKLSLQLDTEIQAKTEAVPDGENFDPLELDRLTEKQGLAAILREAAFDLHEETKDLGSQVATAMRESIASARLIETNQSDLRLLRLVRFSKLGPGFSRLIHQVSRQLGKNVEFDLTCDDGGLDVSVFEQVKTALEHMLRNSVDHGIEMPEDRKARGKSEAGKVSLIIYRQAAEFVIRLMDDGKGIAPETLRKKAVDRGILSDDDRISESEALQLIFHNGLSTADQVTDISGRGVGMDVVQQSIAQIGGSIEVSSKAGFYTQFDIRVPASIMVNGALLASIGEEQVAIPLTSLDGSDFRHRDEVYKSVAEPSERLMFRNEEYEVRYLGSVRGTAVMPAAEAMAEFVPVLFARHGRRRVAFFTDSVTNAEELVIRSLGAQFTSVPGVAGGSLKSDGQPVLALDLNELIRQVEYADTLNETTEDADDSRIVILCVDDSVMMRRTYEKRLASLDYEVVTAEDGEAALDYLAEAGRLPDFIFTDLEMPNMNGFDFIQNLRRIPNMETVPTVVVSSRDGEKHRSEARRVGATDFMAKGANSAEGMQSMILRYLDATALAS
jgi:chemosensory pili system protein ChpA (sensor histidine kinase/response regulator)